MLLSSTATTLVGLDLLRSNYSVKSPNSFLPCLFYCRRRISRLVLAGSSGAISSAAIAEALPELPTSKRNHLHSLLVSSEDQVPAFHEKLHLLLALGVPPHRLCHVLGNLNLKKLFLHLSLSDLHRTVDFLSRFGWPDVVLRRPSLLTLDFDTHLVPRVEFFVSLAGGEEAAAAALIRKLPSILAYSVEHFHEHLHFWEESVGLTSDEIFRIASVYPNMFSVSIENKLRPRVEFLKQCGLDTEDIFKFLVKAPLFLSLSYHQNLAKKLALLVKIGYKHRTREMAMAVGAITRTSCENLQLAIFSFLSHGFSFEDVQAMSKKHPQVLQYNPLSLEKKMEFLTSEMERELEELLAFPAFLGYDLNSRIKVRYEMKKEERGRDMSLNKLLSVPHDRFYSRKNKGKEAAAVEQ